MTKVLDVESSLEAGSEESSERRDERSKSRHDQAVNLEWCVRDRGWRTAKNSLKKLASGARELKLAPNKHWIGFAGDLREDVGAEVTSRADHIVEAHEKGSPLFVGFE